MPSRLHCKHFSVSFYGDNMLRVALLFCLLYFSYIQAVIHEIHLGRNATLQWTINYNIKILQFKVDTEWSMRQREWFAVGFSDYGLLQPADLCIFWIDWKGKTRFQDIFVDENGLMTVDKSQDCNNFRFRKSEDRLSLFFTRKFDTCDNRDYVIEDGTTHIVWAKGKGPLYSIDKMNISSAYASNFERTTLLAYDAVEPEKPKDTFTLDIKASQNRVPKIETYYYCKIIKLPQKFLQKHHIIQYEPAFDPKTGHFLHHMEVYHCLAPAGEIIPNYEGPLSGPDRPKRTQVCKQVLAAWAMGAKPFHLPKEAGTTLGGVDFNQYVMLELHYHNPNLVEGIVDSSGIRLYVTKTLRRFDSGIMELGLEYNDKMAIPQGEKEFKLNGYCNEACTAVGLPSKGITVFGSQLHTHLTGIRIYTKHIRQGVELLELNRDNHFSQEFQEIRRLKRDVKVLPNDALITTCVYNTMDRDNVTLTGFSITDEMCVNYIHYYPKVELEVCKSSIPDSQLRNYFQAMNKWENQNTKWSNGISDNYKSIDWTPIRKLYLQDLYDRAPLSMQCNQSSGARFPGYWEDMPPTKTYFPLMLRNTECRKIGY